MMKTTRRKKGEKRIIKDMDIGMVVVVVVDLRWW
jgi:hypothetical protein